MLSWGPPLGPPEAVFSALVLRMVRAATSKEGAPILGFAAAPHRYTASPFTLKGVTRVETTAADAATDPAAVAAAPDLAADSASAAASASEEKLSGLPITSLRTACRKLQLSSKGKREELMQRLHAAASSERILALAEEPGAPLQLQQTQEASTAGAPDTPSDTNARAAPTRCPKCNRRLSAKARFCSDCGATISTVGQETLREFVERAFWPVREQEVGSNTMRVERGFWQSILQVIGDVPVANLSSAIWEKYLGWEEEGKPTSGLCFYAEGIRTASNRAKLEKKTPIRRVLLYGLIRWSGIDELRCGEPRRIFPYILRHSFATIAATSNPPVPLPVAQAVMRHNRQQE
ncbi:Phage integrase domain containing protein, related [Eimeria mitis]|uniref:Phage integrase domain containing protein, related n=1 Tax=Eimeria mitis TaxID=44415 RepID=U6KGN3_9EIME|nr:Phage integrase domain containing protein, related [Eimeria mitis]CDJ35397.1 Phage integrase domain containing protein, related [Eimeria mitis]